MSYTYFGQTDLRVSQLCQGTAFRDLPRADDPRALRVLHYAMERGINFFDTASAYGWGGAETVLGKAIAGRRDQLVLCTKVPASLPPKQAGQAGTPARYSRTYLQQQLEDSLRRLGTDYVDLYLLHHFDPQTPVDEITASMQELVAQGKARYWGLSNHSVAQIQPYLASASIAGIEEYYNIAGMHLDAQGRSRTRVFEEEIQPLLKKSGIGSMAFSPLDTGHLAPDRSTSPPLSALVKTIDQVAVQLGVARAAICVAWVMHQPGVTSVLCGAESCEHIDANLGGSELQLPVEALAQLTMARQIFCAAQESAHCKSRDDKLGDQKT